MIVITDSRNAVLYQGEHASIKEAVEAAVRGGVSLRGANLRGADLSGVDLSGPMPSNPDFRWAKLSGACLEKANFTRTRLAGADLRGARAHEAVFRGARLFEARLGRAALGNADFIDACLTGAAMQGAYLRYADFRDACLEEATLDGADVSGALWHEASLNRASFQGAIGIPDAPVVPNIDRAILDEIEKNPMLFDVTWWRTETACGTARCRAGWAIHLAGEAGHALEEDLGPSAAGAFIYIASRPGEPVPDFTDTRADALADLRARASI